MIVWFEINYTNLNTGKWHLLISTRNENMWAKVGQGFFWENVDIKLLWTEIWQARVKYTQRRTQNQGKHLSR